MTIETNITRKDYVRAQLYLLFRSKWFGIGYIVLWLVFFIPLFKEMDAKICNVCALIPSLIFSAIPATIMFIFLISSSIFIGFITISQSPGGLGLHQFVIKEDGFFAITAVNETLTKWNGINFMTKTKGFIFIRLGWISYFISRGSFDNQDKYEEFWNELSSRWESNHKK